MTLSHDETGGELARQHERWMGAQARLGVPTRRGPSVRAVLQAMPKRVIPVVVNVPPPCPVNLLRSGSWKIIVELVAVKHGVTFEAIIGPRREAHLTEARHEAIYLVHLHCPHLSYPRMGEHFDRDHTSILHAVRKMAARKLSTLSTSVHNLAEDRLDPIESRPDKGGKPNASVRYAGYPQ